ncbi:MAG: prepilin-type N-terminal cleavage/methylation domain-containing protein, partial [Deltaproteobacteria bacterium]|nr:prepilin-type N-terminal cleavage/methylation domain-containing protein [Deltaproteobacteria bacterium]
MSRRSSGFTLIEILTAIVIVGIVMVAAMQSFTFQAKTHEVITGIADSQKSLTMLARLVERDLRNAGYMVSESAAVCGVDNINGPDMLFISDSVAISNVGDLTNLIPIGENSYVSAKAPGNAGLGSLLLNASVKNTLATSTLTLIDNTLDTDPAYDNTGDDAPDSDYQFSVLNAQVTIAGGVILRDTTDTSKGVACGVIEDIRGSQIDVRWVSPNLTWVNDADILVIPAHVYEIIPEVAGVTPPQLTRNGLLVAEDVEDMQISYFLDLDDDGLTDPGEMRGTEAGAGYLATDGNDGQFLRDVTVSLLVRSAFEPRVNVEQTRRLNGTPQDLENHVYPP